MGKQRGLTSASPGFQPPAAPSPYPPSPAPSPRQLQTRTTPTTPPPPASLLQRQAPLKPLRPSCPRPAPAAGNRPSLSARPGLLRLGASGSSDPPSSEPRGRSGGALEGDPVRRALTPTPTPSPPLTQATRFAVSAFIPSGHRASRGRASLSGRRRGRGRWGREWHRPRPTDARSGRRRGRLLTARLPSSSGTLRGRGGEA